MKPADMYEPDKGRYGDCFRACIASLLELPATEVPHFLDGEKPSTWYEDLSKWLGSRGYAYFEFRIDDGTTVNNYRNISKWESLFNTIGNPIYHVISGKSPRGDFIHSVIGLNGKVIHDPHPSKAGIDNIQEYGFIIKTCNKEL